MDEVLHCWRSGGSAEVSYDGGTDSLCADRVLVKSIPTASLAQRLGIRQYSLQANDTATSSGMSCSSAGQYRRNLSTNVEDDKVKLMAKRALLQQSDIGAKGTNRERILELEVEICILEQRLDAVTQLDRWISDIMIPPSRGTEAEGERRMGSDELTGASDNHATESSNAEQRNELMGIQRVPLREGERNMIVNHLIPRLAYGQAASVAPSAINPILAGTVFASSEDPWLVSCQTSSLSSWMPLEDSAVITPQNEADSLNHSTSGPFEETQDFSSDPSAVYPDRDILDWQLYLDIDDGDLIGQHM